MKKVLVLILLLVAVQGYSQKPENSKQKTDSITVTDSTEILSVTDVDEILNRAGKQLGDVLTKNQWELVRSVFVQEATVTIQKSVERFRRKKKS